MSEDAGAAAGTAEGDTTSAQPQAQDATPGVADRSAEDMLADAVGSDAADDGKAADPAAELAKAQAEAKKWRDMSRQNEKKWKDASPALEELQKIRDSQKTESQRQAEALAAAQKDAAEARQANWRLLAAASHDLDPSLIDDLRGETEEEVSASAERLASAISKRVAEQVASLQAANAAAQNGAQNGAQYGQQRQQRPVESMRAGAMPAQTDAPKNASDWFRQQLSGARNR